MSLYCLPQMLKKKNSRIDANRTSKMRHTTCKLHRKYLSVTLRASSFIKNVPQINGNPIAFQRNFPTKLPRNRHFFPIVFQQKFSRKFPRDSPGNRCFSFKFVPENPAVKFDFFEKANSQKNLNDE